MRISIPQPLVQDLSRAAAPPLLGLGTWRAPKGQVGAAVSHAIKVGYRHIDAAWAYRNEDEVGAAIKKSLISRKELWLTTKVWNTFHAPEHVEKGVDASLKDLGTDYVDLLLMHWPVAFENPKGEQIRALTDERTGKPREDVELSRNPLATWRAMEEIVKKGKARHIGISNFNIRRTRALLPHARIKPAFNQVEANLLCPNEALRLASARLGITLEAYSPLGSAENVSTYLAHPLVRRIAHRLHASPAQVLLGWQIARGIVVLGKSVHPARIEENFGAEGVARGLREDEVQALLDVSRVEYGGRVVRTVDPRSGWGVEDDIFEDGVDEQLQL
ncbi:hypothetical protein OC842_006887 [Tilletia horrida]|uniref:NADP-dependent oxidoreductase domain-containing protein n=1 Tax=Tilletia horrida TaxID=155126 RepID=A0AAN6G9D8_9BASI|nr:hypothetical protein OC842_006887 [Tilletia horrida]